MADDSEVPVDDIPTVSEVSAQLRALVAQTRSLVGEIDTVVDTLHGHSESMQEHSESTFGRPNDGPERNRG